MCEDDRRHEHVKPGRQKWAEMPLLVASQAATPSNCGEALKLCLPSRLRKQLDGRGNDLGKGKNDKDAVTMGYPQPSPKVFLRFFFFFLFFLFLFLPCFSSLFACLLFLQVGKEEESESKQTQTNKQTKKNARKPWMQFRD